MSSKTTYLIRYYDNDPLETFEVVGHDMFNEDIVSYLKTMHDIDDFRDQNFSDHDWWDWDDDYLCRKTNEAYMDFVIEARENQGFEMGGWVYYWQTKPAK